MIRVTCPKCYANKFVWVEKEKDGIVTDLTLKCICCDQKVSILVEDESDEASTVPGCYGQYGKYEKCQGCGFRPACWEWKRVRKIYEQ